MRKFFVFVSILSIFGLLSGCATTTSTPLMSAAESGDINTVKNLIDKGADVNVRDEYQYTPLHKASEGGYTETVKLLIDKGADVNAKGRWNLTPLHYAVREGHADIAVFLVDKGADVNAKEEFFGYAPLHSATSVDIMRLLIEKGARVDEAIRGMGDYKGYTPLSMAAFKGKPELVKYLLDKGADADTAVMALNNCSKRVQGEKGKMWLVQGNEQGIKLLEKVIGDIKAKMVEERRILEEKRKTEELKAIVAAIEGAKTQKESKSPSVQSDIDKPTFAIAERIFGDNDLAVIIGIEGYQSLPKSDYSYDDAKLMAEYVKALGFKSRNIELLTDEKATKSSIEKSLEAWLKNKAKADSKVFVYYSGHGAPDPSTGDAYLVPYDGDPNYLNVTGYPLKRLYDNLGKLQVAEVTVVLDSCFSGAGGRSVLAKGARPLVMMTTSSVLPSNIAVLSATQGSQISTSSPEKGHGVFTYYFLKALKDGKKNILEIYSYIKPLVEDEAKQLNVQQSPSISPDVEKVKGRFGLRK